MYNTHLVQRLIVTKELSLPNLLNIICIFDKQILQAKIAQLYTTDKSNYI
jgi:hypothetical protein